MAKSIRPTKSGRGKGAGIIPFPIDTVFAAKAVGYEVVAVREQRDNRQLNSALNAYNGGDDKALDGVDDSHFYERVVLATPSKVEIRTIDDGYPIGVPVALKVVPRTYTNAQGEQVEGKALAYATEDDVANSTATVGGKTAEFLKKAFPKSTTTVDAPPGN